MPLCSPPDFVPPNAYVKGNKRKIISFIVIVFIVGVGMYFYLGLELARAILELGGKVLSLPARR